MPTGLNEVLEATVASFGLELVDFDLSNRARMLRLFIDRPGSQPGDPLSGVTVEDCERVTRQLQRVLPVEGIEYDRLEVSSPGLDRVVKRPAEFARFVGLELEARLRLPRDGRRRFTGRIAGCDDTSVALDCDGIVHTFALADVERARLVPPVDIGARAAKSKKMNGGVKSQRAARGAPSSRRA